MQTDAHIAILMAVRNGAAHLPAQLASLAAQTHGDWSLIVSDDGSSDASRDICADFAASLPAGQVRIIEGPQQGASANFLHLVTAAPAGAMLAFSDQDDVWLPGKLARAAALLARAQGPAQYSARTLICDGALNVLTASPRFRRPMGLANALVQSCTAGNTSVFNAEGAAVLKAGAGAAAAAGVFWHDWWAYQLITAAGGCSLKDDQPVLKYRQHGGNEMGRNDTPAQRLRRLGLLFSGDYGRWLAANQRALIGSADLLAPAGRRLVRGFEDALALPGPAAALAMARLGLYRQGRAETAALYAAAAAGRLRA